MSGSVAWWRRVAVTLTAASIVAAGWGPGHALAAERVVRLVTDGIEGRFRFEPRLIVAAVGDEVRFVPESRLHAVKSIAGMLPPGIAPYRGRMGEEVRLRLSVPGVYGVKCLAHYQIGMVALVVVGDAAAANWEAARAVRHPPPTAVAMDGLFREARCRLDGGSGSCGQLASGP